jgi:hypothetical protein
MTNLSFIKHRVELHLNGSVNVTGGTDVPVFWQEFQGGSVDAVTGAVVDGVEVPMSGTIRAFGKQEPPRSFLRQFAEIQAGDLIVDVPADGVIAVSPGGTTTLDAIKNKGVRFQWGDQLYVQAEVGEALAECWNAIVQGQRLGRTLLLRRAT